MTTEQIMAHMRNELQDLGDRRETESVISLVAQEVLHYTAVDLVLRSDFEQPQELTGRIMSITARLKKHEPVQYVLGKARFHGMEFEVSPATLIPRPETDRLIDIITDEHSGQHDLRILDVGTGSGCIAISLARAMAWPQVTATDISDEALAVAKANASRLKANVTFRHEDITRAIAPSGTFDIVVSNPPYVCEGEKDAMEPNVLLYEPAGALFVPDGDPLLYYRPLAAYSRKALRQGGSIYLETNRRYGREVGQLLTMHGFTDVQVVKDQFGNDRFVKALKP